MPYHCWPFCPYGSHHFFVSCVIVIADQKHFDQLNLMVLFSADLRDIQTTIILNICVCYFFMTYF